MLPSIQCQTTPTCSKTQYVNKSSNQIVLLSYYEQYTVFVTLPFVLKLRFLNHYTIYWLVSGEIISVHLGTGLCNSA